MAGDVIPPPYVITADDKRGLIVVTGAAVLAFVWSCFLIRVWLRLQSREWRSDGKSSRVALYSKLRCCAEVMYRLVARRSNIARHGSIRDHIPPGEPGSRSLTSWHTAVATAATWECKSCLSLAIQ
jgi:hypothetical protein